jgi:hypothetical protein
MSRHLFRAALLCFVLVSPAAMTSCASHVYRVYDVSYRDYHDWDGREVVIYQRWEVDNHRTHMEFRNLDQDTQRRYWEWRHTHSDEH